MPAKEPKELHTLFVTAFNAGDIEQILALYEKDAKFSLEDGAIIGEGTFNDLIRFSLVFKEMWEQQLSAKTTEVEAYRKVNVAL